MGGVSMSTPLDKLFVQVINVVRPDDHASPGHAVAGRGVDPKHCLVADESHVAGIIVIAKRAKDELQLEPGHLAVEVFTRLGV